MSAARLTQRAARSLLAVGLGLVLLAAGGRAHAGQCRADDAWHGSDKTIHAMGGAAIAAGVTLQTGSPWKGFAWGLAAGALKEAIDGGTGMGHCSAQDFAVTALGAGIGAMGGKLLIRVSRDGKAGQVIYRTEF